MDGEGELSRRWGWRGASQPARSQGALTMCIGAVATETLNTT
ncbi:hypothetical protein ABZ806_23605 [Spirillospora sp. NPDC047418]|jgi:hypothetical protein